MLCQARLPSALVRLQIASGLSEGGEGNHGTNRRVLWAKMFVIDHFSTFQECPRWFADCTARLHIDGKTESEVTKHGPRNNPEVVQVNEPCINIEENERTTLLLEVFDFSRVESIFSRIAVYGSYAPP